LRLSIDVALLASFKTCMTARLGAEACPSHRMGVRRLRRWCGGPFTDFANRETSLEKSAERPGTWV